MTLSKREIFSKFLAQTSGLSIALEVEKAEGVFIYDSQGKRYFDLNSGISVSSLGHRNPHVVNAIKVQLDRYMHTMVYGEHIQTPQTELAMLLNNSLDESLNSIYFLNSGTEVVETAMKLAKRATGRYEIFSCRNAYHGSTQGSESLRSDHDYSSAFLPLLPGIRNIDFNNLDDLKKITKKTAAIILEPVQAEAGVILPQDDYLKKVQERCHETGTLLILDEIQTGFGRTGVLFAHKKYGIVPDILCLGKAMGGGLPIGALVSSRDIMMLFSKNPELGHISTFAGNPVICAAARANLEVLLKEDIISNVLKLEKQIHDRLRGHEIVEEIRSSGLMMAVELKRKKYLKHVVQYAFDNGALIDYFLFNNKAFRLAPPLIYSSAQMDEACDILINAFDYAQNYYIK